MRHPVYCVPRTPVPESGGRNCAEVTPESKRPDLLAPLSRDHGTFLNGTTRQGSFCRTTIPKFQALALPLYVRVICTAAYLPNVNFFSL